MVVGFTHSERYKREKQSDNHQRCRIAHAEVHHRRDQLFVWLHIEAETEAIQALQEGFVEKQSQKKQEVDRADRQIEQTFACLTVVELSQSGKNRKHAGHGRVFLWPVIVSCVSSHGGLRP